MKGDFKKSGIYFDNQPEPDSDNVVTSKGIYNYLSGIQEYIKNQNELSDFETITTNNFVAEYDGFLFVYGGGNDVTFEVRILINNTLIALERVAGHGGNTQYGTCSVVFSKGDNIVISGNAIQARRVKYYKKRDYSIT